MVRLTPELIEDSFQYINPVKEYELCLRGYKIGLIENLGATLNQFDTIDFSDNEIRRLDGFPLMTKIKSLLLNNNKIQYVGQNLNQFLPNIENLVMINNNIEELTEIDNLSSLKSLKYLSLLRNPVAALKHYRLYTIYRIPSLRVLDFKRIRDKERQEAQKLYKGKKLKKSEVPRTFVPGEQLDKLSLNQPGAENGQKQQRVERAQPSKEDIDAIRLAISQAKSIEEIEQLNAMLRSGIIPSHLKQRVADDAAKNNQSMVEDE
ncbi:U2 small nuclear ribonucleo A [Brachionus plicatilis]|uniref:U2 small nuclear ribonucleo A n=1 Tax=Brachionus plicatilis TaxID=10195 RepID=A0A3M7P1U7_BRAPC|nr:U2 small nuclear ribonucleo A [Brachionus plicatilis]